MNLRTFVTVGWMGLAATVRVDAAVPKSLEVFPEGERLVFARVVSAYRANKIAEAVKQRELLRRKYPRSVNLGHAYYLSGVLHFQNGHYAEAVRDFGVVSDKFPQSRKRSAALFAKATTYDRLNLRPLAVGLWREIAREYPGSQEAQRSLVQLKLKAPETLRK